MSSSRRRDEIAEGVGDVEESVNRMFPCALRKSRSIFGARAGPRPMAHG